MITKADMGAGWSERLSQQVAEDTRRFVGDKPTSPGWTNQYYDAGSFSTIGVNGLRRIQQRIARLSDPIAVLAHRHPRFGWCLPPEPDDAVGLLLREPWRLQ